MEVFNRAYDVVRKHEGGYANDVDDPGGETYKGIARRRWPSWEGWVMVDRTKRMYPSQPELGKQLGYNNELDVLVRKFYKLHFWDVIWGDEIARLSEELATDMFDMSVNLGSGRATEFLQRTCNAFNNRQRLYPDILVDGDFGPQTIKAYRSCVRTRGVELLYKGINILQGSWYLGLMEGSERFEKYIGWFERVDFINEDD